MQGRTVVFKALGLISIIAALVLGTICFLAGRSTQMMDEVYLFRIEPPSDPSGLVSTQYGASFYNVYPWRVCVGSDTTGIKDCTPFQPQFGYNVMETVASQLPALGLETETYVVESPLTAQFIYVSYIIALATMGASIFFAVLCLGTESRPIMLVLLLFLLVALLSLFTANCALSFIIVNAVSKISDHASQHNIGLVAKKGFFFTLYTWISAVLVLLAAISVVCLKPWSQEEPEEDPAELPVLEEA